MTLHPTSLNMPQCVQWYTCNGMHATDKYGVIWNTRVLWNTGVIWDIEVFLDAEIF